VKVTTISRSRQYTQDDSNRRCPARTDRRRSVRIVYVPAHEIVMKLPRGRRVSIRVDDAAATSRRRPTASEGRGRLDGAVDVHTRDGCCSDDTTRHLASSERVTDATSREDPRTRCAAGPLIGMF